MPATTSTLGGQLIQRLEVQDPFVAAFLIKSKGNDALVEKTTVNGHIAWVFDYSRVKGIENENLSIQVTEIAGLLSILGLEVTDSAELRNLRERRNGRGFGSIERTHRPRRSHAEKAKEVALKDLKAQVKRDLKLSPKGMLNEQDRARFDKEFELRRKKLNL